MVTIYKNLQNKKYKKINNIFSDVLLSKVADSITFDSNNIKLTVNKTTFVVCCQCTVHKTEKELKVSFNYNGQSYQLTYYLT